MFNWFSKRLLFTIKEKSLSCDFTFVKSYGSIINFQSPIHSDWMQLFSDFFVNFYGIIESSFKIRRKLNMQCKNIYKKVVP